MSEHDEQPPMTRRERRLRELAETGALDLSEALQQAKEPVAPPEDAPSVDSGDESDEIEISPFNEDGTPRSRREIRQLREAALAARASARDEASPQVEAIDGERDASAPREDSAPADDDVPSDTASPTPEAESADDAVSIDGAAPGENAPRDDAQPLDDAEAQAPEAGDPEAEIVDGLFETAKNASEAPETSALDFDSLMAPPTAPFTVDELREAEQPHSDEAEAAVAPAEEPAEVDPEPEPAEAAKPKRRFPWSRNKGAATAEQADTSATSDEQGASEEVVAEVVESEAAPEPEAEVVVEAEPVEGPETDARDDAADAATADAVPEPAADVPGPVRGRRRGFVQPSVAETADEESVETDDANESQKYSFPDIQPPEEWRSVFDDPASRTVGGQGAAEKGDFDDLISRAVAQEGSAGSSTSALILPSMPHDTGGLAGPLGTTGELYITGSIELPRSLGETGGHSSLHDSLQMEPVVMPEVEDGSVGEQGPTPVSAKHAVSARMPSGSPVVAKPTRDKSKLPLVLTLSGGGLLIVVVGLGVWGATNGMFSG